VGGGRETGGGSPGSQHHNLGGRRLFLTLGGRKGNCVPMDTDFTEGGGNGVAGKTEGRSGHCEGGG